MRFLIPLLILLVCGMAALSAVSVEDALKKDAEYQTAVRSLETAKDDMTKVKADPGATPIALTQAQEKLSELQPRLAVAEISARKRTIDAWETVLTSRLQLELANARLEQARKQLQAAQIKQTAGAISDQELARAKETQAKAETTVKEMENNVAVAELRVKPYGVITTETPGEPAPLDPAKLTDEMNPDLIAAANRAKAAQRALALAQGPDTALLDRAVKERELHDAQDALRDTGLKIDQQFESAKRAYLLAQEKHKLAAHAVTLALDEWGTAKKRFDAGAISTIALGDAEVTALDARGQQESARADLWQASYALLQVAGGLR